MPRRKYENNVDIISNTKQENWTNFLTRALKSRIMYRFD